MERDSETVRKGIKGDPNNAFRSSSFAATLSSSLFTRSNLNSLLKPQISIMKFNLTFLSLLSSLVVVYALPAVDNAALPPQVEVKPLSDVKNIARDYDQSGNYDNDHSGDYDNDHDHSGGYDNGYDNGDNNGYGNGYKDYDRCSQEREDTLCSPSNADRLGRTFDLLYKGKDGRRAVSNQNKCSSGFLSGE